MLKLKIFSKLNQAQRLIQTPLRISLLISFILGLLALQGLFYLQPEVPLFYSLARDSQHLVSKNWLLVIPAISFIINLLHGVIIRLSIQTEKLLLQLFAWTTVGIQLVIGLALVRVILIIS